MRELHKANPPPQRKASRDSRKARKSHHEGGLKLRKVAKKSHQQQNRKVAAGKLKAANSPKYRTAGKDEKGVSQTNVVVAVSQEDSA